MYSATFLAFSCLPAGHPLATRECELNESTQEAQWLEPVTQWCGDSREQVAIVDLMLVSSKLNFVAYVKIMCLASLVQSHNYI